MNSIESIEDALTIRLSTMPTLPDIVFLPNSDDNNLIPSSSDTFLAVHQMPTGTDQPTLNDDGYSDDTGIFQISVFTPKSKRSREANRLADAIRAHYARTWTGDVDGQRLKIRNVQIGTPSNDNGNHYMIPVSIYWRVIG